MRLLNYSISIMKNLVFHLFGSISYVSGNPVDTLRLRHLIVANLTQTTFLSNNLDKQKAENA